MKPRQVLKNNGISIVLIVFLAMVAGAPFCGTTIHASTVLFQDNFESGKAADWVLQAGWQVINQGGNFVLAGSGHAFASTGDTLWTDYDFKAKVKLNDSGSAVHLNYRNNCERYFIGLNSTGLYLNKTKPCGTHTILVNLYDPHEAGRWYSVNISGRQGRIRVYVDDSLKIDYTDSDPVLNGPISFETLTASPVYIDEVMVTTDIPFSETHWESTGGPLGGLGYDVRIHPQNKNIMYVTDNFAGVARSEDAGQYWYQSNQGISIKGGSTGDTINIFSLTIDPNNPAIVWAGTFADGAAFGVFKSTDNGRSWDLKIGGMSLDGAVGLVFRGFTIQPGNSNVVYAQAEVTTDVNGLEFNKVKGRVYKTLNGGESWQLAWEGNNLARYLIIHPSNPKILYLSTGIFDREAYDSACGGGNPGGVGVLKSNDEGLSWTPINNGLSDLYVGALRMHPTNPNILFAATGNNACSGGYTGITTGGLFRTTDGGQNWSKVVANDNLTTVNFSPSNPNIVYSGSASAFYRSDDGGLTWNSFNKGFASGYGPKGIKAGFPIDVVVDPDNPNVLYANNYGGGVFRSVDGAVTWEAWSRGYTGAEIHRVFIPYDQPSSVFAIGRSGPFKGSNFGLNWTGITNGNAVFLGEWYDVASKPADASLILITDEHQGVILRSIDSGNWFEEVLRHPLTNASNPNMRQGFKSIAFSSSNANIVYAGLAKNRLTVLNSTPVGTVIYKSVNAGQAFSPLPSILDGSNVNRLIVSPYSSNIVYAATSSGIYKTIDGAASWTKLANLGTRHIEGLAVDFRQPEYIIAGEVFGGVWISQDGGLAWTGPHNTGFNSPNPYITALSFDPRSSNTVFAGDLYSGVYQSNNSGLTWAPFPDWKMSGLSVRAVKDLVLNNEVIYVATMGGGVFRYLFGVTTWPQTLCGDWCDTWMDWVNDVYFPWGYQDKYGWIYIFGTDPNNLWFYNLRNNDYWWTTADLWPYIYFYNEAGWFYNEPGTNWFVNLNTGQWVQK